MKTRNSLILPEKILFKYITLNTPVVFIENDNFGSQNITVVVTKKNILYIILHLTLNSVLQPVQLVEMFAYEIPQNNLKTKSLSNIIVYNFSSLVEEKKYYLIVNQTRSNKMQNKHKNNYWLNSIENFYSAANWLEREIIEFYNTIFQQKKDIRNLMLQYGDKSAPMLKLSPMTGVKEYYFSVLTQTISQNYLELTN